MDKIAGLVLDVYDDPKGEVLRGIFPTEESLPALIKEASHITPELHAQLPDDAFALVLQNNGETTLRKYACVDGGNTALNVEYFIKTAHKLPTEAQKVAAQNLIVACGWYGLEPPEELQKIAGKTLDTLKRKVAPLLLAGMVAGPAAGAAKAAKNVKPAFQNKPVAALGGGFQKLTGAERKAEGAHKKMQLAYAKMRDAPTDQKSALQAQHDAAQKTWTDLAEKAYPAY